MAKAGRVFPAGVRAEFGLGFVHEGGQSSIDWIRICAECDGIPFTVEERQAGLFERVLVF